MNLFSIFIDFFSRIYIIFSEIKKTYKYKNIYIMKTYEKITFKPLARNRYRCNQTGVIVSASKTQSYRSSLLGLGRKKSQVRIYTYPGTVYSYTTIRCPVCNDRIWVGITSGVVVCDNHHQVNVKVKRR